MKPMIERIDPEFIPILDAMKASGGDVALTSNSQCLAYRASRNALLVQKLAQRDNGRDYIWFSPGLTHGTQGFAKGPALQRFMIEKVMTKITAVFGMSQSPDKGGQRCAEALSGKVGNNGDLIGTPDRKLLGDPSDQKPLNPSFTQQALIDEFWNLLQSIRPMPDE